MRNSLHELNMLTHKLEEFNDFEKHAHIFFIQRIYVSLDG